MTYPECIQIIQNNQKGISHFLPLLYDRLKDLTPSVAQCQMILNVLT